MKTLILGLITKQELYNLLAALAQTDADYRTLDIVAKATTGHELPPPIISKPVIIELPSRNDGH